MCLEFLFEFFVCGDLIEMINLVLCVYRLVPAYTTIWFGIIRTLQVALSYEVLLVSSNNKNKKHLRLRKIIAFHM